MVSEAEVLFELRGSAGIIKLNRPKALNALSLPMVRAIHPQLARWAHDDSVSVVVIRGAGDRAFCAGGDVRTVRDLGLAGDRGFVEFFGEEYKLNTLVKRFPKPFVALVDGIVMGGGVGLSVHGSHRAIGEKTVFAMPETAIGLFPDVGGTWFLPRLPGYSGTWLALTGARLGQADVVWAGIGTHAVSAASFDRLVDLLADGTPPDQAINEVAAPPAAAATLPGLMPVIDRCFSADSVAEIVARLDAETGTDAEWAHAQAETIRTKSPTSLAIALHQMRLGPTLTFEECMRIEYRIVNRIFTGRDFYEGVRAVLVDKDNAPNWSPPRIEDVSAADTARYFEPVEPELDLSGIDKA
jgi:enoyl-CoA hydratase